jgi:hypothetical protein
VPISLKVKKGVVIINVLFFGDFLTSVKRIADFQYSEGGDRKGVRGNKPRFRGAVLFFSFFFFFPG